MEAARIPRKPWKAWRGRPEEVALQAPRHHTEVRRDAAGQRFDALR
jgi:hypothetical protein